MVIPVVVRNGIQVSMRALNAASMTSSPTFKAVRRLPPLVPDFSLFNIMALAPENGSHRYLGVRCINLVTTKLKSVI
jgi:hypothetical protein